MVPHFGPQAIPLDSPLHNPLHIPRGDPLDNPPRIPRANPILSLPSNRRGNPRGSHHLDHQVNQASTHRHNLQGTPLLNLRGSPRFNPRDGPPGNLPAIPLLSQAVTPRGSPRGSPFVNPRGCLRGIPLLSLRDSPRGILRLCPHLFQARPRLSIQLQILLLSRRNIPFLIQLFLRSHFLLQRQPKPLPQPRCRRPSRFLLQHCFQRQLQVRVLHRLLLRTRSCKFPSYSLAS